VFLDGDYSDRPDELPLLLTPIIDGRADITLVRAGEAEHSWGVAMASGFGNRLAASLIRLFYGLEISDLARFALAGRSTARARPRRDHLWLAVR